MDFGRPATIPDRALLRERGMMTAWIVYRGVRYGFRSPEALYFAGFTLGDVQEVEPGSLVRVPRVPPDGTFVQEFKSGDLFVIARGHRLSAGEEDMYSLGQSLEDVVGVPGEQLERFRTPVATAGGIAGDWVT
jgi:hypothetical protein